MNDNQTMKTPSNRNNPSIPSINVPLPNSHLRSSSNLSPRTHQILRRLRRMDTHSLLRKNIDKEWARSIIFPSRVHSLVILVALDVLNVHVEEVGGVHWAAFGFGVELRGEDGAGFVDHAFVETLA